MTGDACSAILALALLGSCTEASPDWTGVRAGEAARAQGVDAYDVLEATKHDIDARLLGRTPGRLRIHSADGETTQQLDGAAPLVLSTSRARIDLKMDGHSLVAERSGDRWVSRGALDATAEAALRLMLAVDVDFAVQGSSTILGGTTFARCTEQCDKASRCAEHGGPAQCASNMVLCGACLEQEP
jgi:hypothetical protein